MLAPARSRLCLLAARSSRLTARANLTSSAARQRNPNPENPIPTNTPSPKEVTSISETNAVPVDSMGGQDASIQESVEAATKQLQRQAPNRDRPWAKGQQERSAAMTGPRFEQTMMEWQPQPYAAIELIHKQPVRWTKERRVACDGGGGPLGHPRVFINTDKPMICTCEYCGLPFANEHNRKAIEALPRTSYPLEPLGHPAEVNETQRITDAGFEQR